VNIPQRLRALSAEIHGLQTEVGILEEQIAFQTEVADDARIRAVVSETPLADREAREADGDLARLVRLRQETLQRLQTLRDDQDSLLERLLEDQGNR
jgi:hypothetical protein